MKAFFSAGEKADCLTLTVCASSIAVGHSAARTIHATRRHLIIHIVCTWHAGFQPIWASEEGPGRCIASATAGRKPTSAACAPSEPPTKAATLTQAGRSRPLFSHSFALTKTRGHVI